MSETGPEPLANFPKSVLSGNLALSKFPPIVSRVSVYEVPFDVMAQPNQAGPSFSSAIYNAIGYGMVLKDITLVQANNRVRITFDKPFPQVEMDSFEGRLVRVFP